MLIAFVTSCKKTDKLVGIWERVGDNQRFAGMRIQVTEDGDSFRAVIVKATEKCNENGFFEGDVKWKNIKKTAENKYEYEGLLKDASDYKVKSSFYSPYYLEIINDSLIYTRISSNGGADETSSEQNWVKIKDPEIKSNSSSQQNVEEHRKPYSGNDYKYYTDWKFKVVSIGTANDVLIIVDENNNPVKYDEDVDYAEYDIVEYAFYAKAVFMSANDHDCNGRYYFDSYEKVNQNINYVFHLPVKNEIQNEKIKDFFNKPFYDYKKYLLYNDKKGYGYQSFVMSDDGTKRYGIMGVVNPNVKFEKNDEGNIQIH